MHKHTYRELYIKYYNTSIIQEPLRDEVYCQIIKQLTDNRLKTSEERGWELLWIACGLFPCSNVLLKEINMFFQSKVARFPIAADCQHRLLKSTKYDITIHVCMALMWFLSEMVPASTHHIWLKWMPSKARQHKYSIKCSFLMTQTKWVSWKKP